MAKFVDPLYLKITNPRNTNSGTSIPSAQDLFKGLSVNSQYKVSLGLQRFGVPYAKESETLENHLTACGVFDEYESTNFNYDFFASEAMLPGANFDITEQPGAYQGMLEYNATRRIFPDFEVTFYVDDKYNIIRIFEEWMNFINPLYTTQGKYIGGYEGQTDNEFNYPAQPYYRMQYPKNYKREINITKFERHLIKNLNQSVSYEVGCNPQHLLSYRFIDAFPKQVTAMPMTYEGSTITRLTVIFGYTRYITVKDNGPDTSSSYGNEDNVAVMDIATRNARKNYGEIPKIKLTQSTASISEENKKSTSNITTAETVKDIQKHAHQFDISGQTSGKDTFNPIKETNKAKAIAAKNLKDSGSNLSSFAIGI